MKENKFKIIFVLFLATLSLASCLKKSDMNIDPEKLTGNIMELQFIQENGSTINSGMQYFSGGALTYPGTDDVDTAHYNVSLGGPATLGKDLTVTVGVDASKILDNFTSDGIKYELMPDSLYHFVETTATVKAGDRIAPMHIVFYPSKINITKSYMLPVVIKDAAGQIISSNFSTIYFHVIGNPIAGAYTQEWIRYNNSAGTGTPAYDQNLGSVTFAPVDPNTISINSGTGTTYLLSFTNTNGILSNFRIKFDPASVTATGITITGGPTVVIADPVARKYVFNFTYNNSAGSGRNITDKFQ